MTGRKWAYLGLSVGGVVSIAANVAHSYVPPAGAVDGWRPHDGAVVSAIFWPVALFLAIEILARVPWPAGWLWVAVRYLGLLPVALVAAVVSYRHLSGLLAYYGEDGLSTIFGPLAVDGLMVLATAALIATGRRAAGTADVDEVSKIDLTVHNINTDNDLDRVSKKKMADRPQFSPGVRRKRPADQAAAKVARARQRFPDATQPEVAKRTGLGVRTVARHWHANNGGPVPATALAAAPDLPVTPVAGPPN